MLVASLMVFAGGIGDFVLTMNTSVIPESHQKFLKVSASEISDNLQLLDAAFIRSIGGTLIAIAIAALALLYLPIRQGNKFSLFTLVLIITISEGNNSYQMYKIDSQYYFYTLSCVVLTWIGAILWLTGISKNSSIL